MVLGQTQATELRRGGDGVIALRGLELRPLPGVVEQITLVLELERVEDRHAEVTLAPHEIVLAGLDGDGLPVLGQPRGGLLGEFLD